LAEEVTVRILEIDNSKNRISLTMRTQERQARPERRRRQEVNHDAIFGLKAGDTVEGIVKSITPIGAFVDIGVGKDGLVHISELSDTRVEKVEDAVQIGKGYTFKIIEIDAEHGRISLSLRQSQPLTTTERHRQRPSGHWQSEWSLAIRRVCQHRRRS
jgi:ribosomal protein S1